jgi:selenophosphate synthase
MISGATSIAPEVAEPLRSILLDPQTSGGLLIALDPEDSRPMLEAMLTQGVEAAEIGTVEERAGSEIVVV